MNSISDQVYQYYMTAQTYVISEWKKLSPKDKEISTIALSIFSMLLGLSIVVKVYRFFKPRKIAARNIDPQNILNQEAARAKAKADEILAAKELPPTVNGLWEGEGIVKHGSTTKQGTFVKGVLHGKGKLTNSEYIFNGDFENGVFVKGKRTTVDSADCYEGTFDIAGDLIKGTGICRYKDDVYNGEFVGKYLTGKGKITRNDGTILEGTFVEDKLQTGKKILPDGEAIFEGTFLNDQLKNGKKTLKNGIVFEGPFKDDMLHGKGIQTDKESIWTGDFENGVFIKGKKSRTDDSNYREGTFNKEGFLKNGIYVTGGCRYEGNYEGAYLEGEGKKTHIASGTIWEGTFERDFLQKGKKTLKDGTIFEGSFQRDLLNGKGTKTLLNGCVLEGVFVDDVLK